MSGNGADHARTLADVPVRPAASVILLRNGPSGVQTYLLRRSSKMEFAPDVTVFPGGGAEPEDNDDPRITAIRETEEECGVVLAPDALVPLSRWITPPGRPRRYDTHFFVAVQPDGVEADCCTTEAVSAYWSTPQETIDAWLAGEHKLMAPTFSQLFQLLPFDRADAALEWAAHHADLTPIAIVDGMRDDERTFPGDAEYEAGVTRH